MLSDSSTKPPAPLEGAPGGSAAEADASVGGASYAQPEEVVVACTGAANTASTPTRGDGTAAAAAPSSSSSAACAPPSTAQRKRVFTFQKRWLHTLPIMEKVLPDSALDAASLVALRAANLLGDDGKPTDDAGAREVIVCMLCDDPNSNREMLKLWSRLNCRRGRIENHLMSKHPEFMLLLKQKRETEGDLAVQIFLQNMREGRCNVRSEISAGLYSHMQSMNGVDPHGSCAKRSFNHDEFVMPTTTAAAATVTPVPIPSTTAPPVPVHGKQTHGAFAQPVTSKDPVDDGEVESRRKRLRVEAAAADELSNEAPAMHSVLAASLLSYQGPAVSPQWRNLLTNKMVVILGGEKPEIARLATNLWLMGANVLITFNEFGSMEAFSASYLAQFHTAEGVEPPRGVMLPLFCSLQSRSQIEDWSRSIATKFDQVDCLINSVAKDDLVSKSDRMTAQSPAPAAQTNGHMSSEVVSSSSLSSEVCRIFSSTCMQRSSRSTIIYITTAHDGNSVTIHTSAKVESLTKSLARALRASNVQVNCITVEQPTVDSPSSAEEDLELLHTILYLMSPASANISGSSLCLRRANALAPDAGSLVAGTATTATTETATASTSTAAAEASTVGAAETAARADAISSGNVVSQVI